MKTHEEFLQEIEAEELWLRSVGVTATMQKPMLEYDDVEGMPVGYQEQTVSHDDWFSAMTARSMGSPANQEDRTFMDSQMAHMGQASMANPYSGWADNVYVAGKCAPSDEDPPIISTPQAKMMPPWAFMVAWTAFTIVSGSAIALSAMGK